MKAKVFFVTFLMALGLIACEMNTESVKQTESELEKITVSLEMSGEINISQNPLTRFTFDDRDLIGIQVYSCPSSGGSYKPYAYGLFDNISDLTLELVDNHKYNFEILLIVDGKDHIFGDYVTVDAKEYYAYGNPFKASNSYNYNPNSYQEITIAQNEFVISDEFRFSSLRNIRYQLKDSQKDDYLYFNSDVYYGEVIDFVPTKDNNSISIFMKRMSYGLKVIAGEFFTEGTISVILTPSGISGTVPTYEFLMTPENTTLEKIFADDGVASMYIKEAEDSDIGVDLDFAWTKADGSVVNWKEQDHVKFTRLKQTIINLEYYEDSTADSMVTLHCEDTPMTEGDSYTIGDDQDEYDW